MNYRFISLCSVCVLQTIFAGAGTLLNKDYLNNGSNPAEIIIPYYEKGKSEQSELKLILQPGDLYQHIEGKNGYVYEKYGFMPNVATNLMLKEQNKYPKRWLINWEKDKLEYDRWVIGSLSTNMPQWWIDGSLSEFENKRNDLEIEKGGELFDEYLFNSTTNITESNIEELSNPFLDPDNDGLINRDELLAGSNPLLNDRAVLTPKFIKITPNDSNVITTRFCAINLLNTNAVYRIVFNSYTYDSKYVPKIECLDKKTNLTDCPNIFSFNFAPKEVLHFIAVFKSNYLPFYPKFLRITLNHVDCLPGNTKTITFYTDKDYSPGLNPPKLISPKVGQCVNDAASLDFKWDCEEKGSDNYGLSFKPLFYDLSGPLHDGTFGNSFSDKLFYRINKTSAKYVNPGIYLWRVVMSSDFNKTTVSDWGWFAVGREISPPQKEEFKPQYHYNNILSYGYNPFVAGDYYVMRVCATNSYKKPIFLKPLPKGMVEAESNGYFLIQGIIGTPGAYTNWVLKLGLNGTVKTNFCVFSVKNPDVKIVSQSIYNVNEEAVCHKLTVNVPFKYDPKKHFGSSLEGKSIDLDSNSKCFFNSPLPDGLEYKLEEDDYIISGVPKIKGVFTNYFIVSNKWHTVREKHLFLINDIGEPPPRIDEIGASFLASFHPGIIVHTLKKGLKDRYPMYMDIMGLDFKLRQKYFEKTVEKQIEVSFLEPLPDNFNLKFEKKKVDQKDFEYYMLYSFPKESGTFTNYSRIANGIFVYTNMHIFRIRDK